MWILADQFDPDSPSGHTLRARATALEKGRDSFFRISRTVIPVPSFRSLQKWARRQGREAASGARDAYKKFMTQVLKIDFTLKKSPFGQWEESKSKERVQVMVTTIPTFLHNLCLHLILSMSTTVNYSIPDYRYLVLALMDCL